MRRDEFPTFIDWYFANEQEYRAVADAEDGNTYALAEIVEQRGFLATKEAREYVAARIRGEKKPVGQKRTVAQLSKEVGILGMVRSIQQELGCGEHTARSVFLDRFPDICDNEETLRTYIRRAKLFFKEALGREPGPVVQKGEHSEPE